MNTQAKLILSETYIPPDSQPTALKKTEHMQSTTQADYLDVTTAKAYSEILTESCKIFSV